MTGYPMIDVFSEDIAEIRSCIYGWYQYYHPENTKRMDELTEIMNKIYNGLFMDCKPVILFDKSKPDIRSCNLK